MITKGQKETAQWAMDYALKNGCQSARVSIITADSSSFEYRDTQLDQLEQSSENKLYIELFVDGRYGSFSTNRIEKKEVESFIDMGIASTKYLAEDLCRQLPDPKRYFKPNGKSLDTYDKSISSISPDSKLNVARQAVEEIYGTNDKIISVSASYYDGVNGEYMIASNGFEAEDTGSSCGVSVQVALKTGGDARAESYWYDSAIYWNDMKPKGVAKIALDRALRKIGQQKIKSGTYSLLLDNTVSSRVLSPLIGAMYGSGLQQKNSFLIGKLGETITSDKFTVIDTPHIQRAFGARWYDGEGVATKEQPIIENGVLKTYFIDTYNALKIETAPTIGSPSILGVKLGDKNFDALLKTIDNGIWVTGFNGGNSNSTTGDFSFGVEGFLVENGKATQPISEMNITGNILTLWNNLIAIGNDPRLNSSWRVPSLLFDGVNFSGL